MISNANQAEDKKREKAKGLKHFCSFEYYFCFTVADSAETQIALSWLFPC